MTTWSKQKERYEVLPIRVRKDMPLLADVKMIAEAEKTGKRIYPARIARRALAEYVFAWKRDHGMEIPPIKLQTRLSKRHLP